MGFGQENGFPLVPARFAEGVAEARQGSEATSLVAIVTAGGRPSPVMAVVAWYLRSPHNPHNPQNSVLGPERSLSVDE
jgi:hypothetical protein